MPVHELKVPIPANLLIIMKAEEKLFLQTSFTAFKKTPERIERSGDLIVETGHQEVSVKQRPPEGGLFSTRQKYMHIFRLTPIGWRYAVLMSNHCG